VSVASLDLVEVPPSKANEIYRALVRSIRYPDSDERGLGPLLRQALDHPAVLNQFVARSPRQEDCPIARALLAYLATFRAKGWRKALAFCNSRAEIEAYAAITRERSPFGSAVYVHYSNIEPGRRRAIER
jgi:hypothetical protein